MMIQVTAEDIRQGTANRDAGRCLMAACCPVAMALTRHLKVKCTVIGKNAWIGDHYVSLTKKVEQFVEAFDDGKPVKSFRFRINLPKTTKGKTK